jgi:hypothetical protein
MLNPGLMAQNDALTPHPRGEIIILLGNVETRGKAILGVRFCK